MKEPGKIKWKLSEILESKGIKISPYDLWTQQGVYRSPKWDLARWGCSGKWIDKTKPQLNLHIYSWDTMTDCCRYGIELITSEDSYQMNNWEVEVCRKESK